MSDSYISSAFWLGTYERNENEADAHYAEGYVWLGEEDFFENGIGGNPYEADARYDDEYVWIGNREEPPHYAAAHFVDGYIWLGPPGLVSSPKPHAVARYSDGYIWLGKYEGSPHDAAARYNGDDAGAIAAAVLLLLEDSDAAEETDEEGQSETESDSYGSNEDSSVSDSSYEYTPSYSTSVNPPPPGSSFLLVAGLVLLGLLLIGWLLKDSNKQGFSGYFGDSPSAVREYEPRPIEPEPLAPPRFIVQLSGESEMQRMLCERPVDVYEDHPVAMGVDTATLKQVGTIQAGQWVTTGQSVHMSPMHLGKVTNSTGYSTRVTDGPPLRVGQTLYLYLYEGHGCWESWFTDRFLVVCEPEHGTQPHVESWMKVKSEDGIEGWTNSTDSFVSLQELNYRIAQKISNAELNLEDKLSQIDDLVRLGASLNGDGLAHGASPIEAAIQNGDINLLKALATKGMSFSGAERPIPLHESWKKLMESGINIQSSTQCPAFAAVQVALKPGGDELLEFLLASGMRFTCLDDPPLHMILRFGLQSPEYPVKNALKVAELLMRKGHSPHEKDTQGRTMFDVLNAASGAPKAEELSQALRKLESEFHVL